MARARVLRSVQLCLLVLSILSTALPAAAGQFTTLVVLGDSLSDTGAVFAVTHGAVPASPPYYAGRFSDCPDSTRRRSNTRLAFREEVDRGARSLADEIV